MYSRQEASKLKQEFWTTFGQYMSPVLSAEGEKINWINYKTGEKNIHFKMDADNKSAYIGIELLHNDPEIQQIYFHQFEQLKKFLDESVLEEWQWRLNDYHDDGKVVSRIFKKIEEVSIFNRNDWPALISFFKPRIIALDTFWSQVKYSFEALR